MKPTLNDIARQTGLSIATVSRALHRSDSPNVSGETRERVRQIARELGYRPNLLSRSLVTGKTHTVSYWTFDAFAPYYAAVAREICAQAARRGYFVHIHSSFHPAAELEPAGAEGLGTAGLALSFDGIIACDVAYADNDYAAQLYRARVPLVGIGINYPTDCDYVGIDLEYGARLLMRHLLDRGCRRIAHVCQEDAAERGDRRARVYQEMMTEADLPVEWVTIHNHRRDEARKRMAEYATRRPLPDALFCANDEVAVGCYRGLADQGITVPDDILLAGYDGIAETAYHLCPITTVATPVAPLGALAWDYLEARIADPERPLQQMLLRPELIVQRSTDPTA